MQAFGLIGAREVPYFWLELISAVLAVVIGLLLHRHIDAGLLFFSMLLVVYFMVEGIVKTIFALSIRPFANWGWVLVVGLSLEFPLRTPPPSACKSINRTMVTFCAPLASRLICGL